jgi:hypothetical protein
MVSTVPFPTSPRPRGDVVCMRALDSKALMCDERALCRPAARASDTVAFLPLTARDDAPIGGRWP